MRIKAIYALIVCCLGTLFSSAALAESDVIYQAFNERFADLVPKLPQLASLGYDYIQVSPVAKSADDNIWWARYQPMDLTVIDSPLGNEADLTNLIAAAHKAGLKVLVDAVLNHMAAARYNNNSLQYAYFGPQDFHFADTRPCIADYGNRTQVTTWWLCDPSTNNNLPDLNTSSEYVRGQHKAFLAKLIGLGVDGFRFDAAKHIEPEYWQAVLPSIAGHFYYGEVIGQTLAESQLYTPLMRVTDFHLLSTLLGAFSADGDLRNLVDPESVGAALPGSSSVVFARNHDTAMHSDFYNFGDLQDALLATAFVVGRGVGSPMIYRDDFSAPLVTNAIRFRRAVDGQGTYVRRGDEVCDTACDPRTLLFVERGAQGVMIINSANAWSDFAAAKMPGLDPGCYRELTYDFPVTVAIGTDGQKWITAWGNKTRAGLQIGPRSALFLTKRAATDCAM